MKKRQRGEPSRRWGCVAAGLSASNENESPIADEKDYVEGQENNETKFLPMEKAKLERKKQKWNESPVADEKSYVMRVQSPKKSNENPVADDN